MVIEHARNVLRLFTDNDIMLPRDYSKHSADLLFDLPRLFDGALAFEDFAAPPRFPHAAQTRAEALTTLIPPWGHVIAVHADTKPAKMWPLDRFVTVLDVFMQRHSDFVAVAVGASRTEVDTGRYSRRVILR
jgi:hypothetical protein